MKKYTTLQNKMASVIMIIAAFLLCFISCNTEDIDPNVPHIEVDQTIVDISGSGGEVVLNITSNRSWATSFVPNSEDWIITDKNSGKNDGQIALTIAPNTGTDRETTLRIATSSIYVDVRIRQTGDISTTVLYADDFGSGLTESPWPNVDAYTGYNITGAGASNVTYSAEGGAASVRGNSASTGYTGASGNHNIMMAAAGASFRINNINPLGNTSFNFSFGSNETNTTLQLYYSVDGTNWTDIPYTKTTVVWGLVEGVTFDIPTGSTQLFLKFTAAATTYGTRVDDVKLIGYVGTPSDLSISPSSLSFTAASETKSFNITSTKAWTVTVSSADTWCTVSAASGNNNAPIDVTVTANAGAQRTATITIATTDNSTTRTLTVTQTADAGDVIWLENVGTTASSGNPAVTAFTDWTKGGSGGGSVTYSGTNTSVRVSVPSIPTSGTPFYSGASGVNSVFFGAATSSFEATGITLSGVATASLTFGISKTTYTTTNVWDNINSGDITLYYAINGGAYTPVTWTHTLPTDNSITWVLATAVIPTAGATSLNLKWECTVASVVRLDDMKLVASGSGSTEYLSLSTNNLNFVAAGENKTFDITSNTAWTVSVPAADASWCHVSSASGNNDATITVTADSHTGTARSTTITVSGTGVANQTVAITQSAPETPSDLTKVEWDFSTLFSAPESGLTDMISSDASTSKLTTTANSGAFNAVLGSSAIYNYVVAGAGWDVIGKAWIMEIPVAGFTGGDVNVSFIPQSSNTGPRDFAVEWSADGTSWSTATAAQEYTVANSTGQNKTITITTSGITNKLYIRLITKSITAVNGSAVGSGGTSRLTGKVTIEKVSAPTQTLTVNPTSLSFVAAGENKTFDITSNTTWTVDVPTADATWCHVSSASGNNDATITVTADANTGAARNTTITISGVGVTPDKTVAISQAAGGGGTSTPFSATWNFNGITATWAADNSPCSTAPTLVGSIAIEENLTASNFLNTGSAANNSWGSTGFAANTATNTETTGIYATVKIKSATKSISISTISGNIRHSATGATKTAILYQIGSGSFTFAYNIDNGTGTAAAGNNISLDLSSITGLQNIPANTTVVIKLVPNTASADTGTWYLNSNTATMNALKIEGTEI
jgi:hypothetical protein